MSKTFLIVTLFFLLFSLPRTGKGQMVESSLVLHLDKGFYVTGEVIWFKVYIPTRWEGQRFLTLDIFDERGKRVANFGLTSGDQDYVPGYFPIPYEWNTGWYRMIISGVQQKDSQPYELLRAQFPIYNDLKELPEGISFRDPSDNDDKQEEISGECEIQLDPFPPKVSPGDSLELGFRVRTQAGEPLAAHASVRVYDLGLTGPEVWSGPNIFSGKVFPEDFEVYGHPVVQGALFHSDGTPYVTNFFGAYEPARKEFHYDIAYDGNYFTQHFPTRYGAMEVQFMDFLEDNIDIQILTLPSPDPLIAPPPLYTPGIIAYLEASAQRKKIFKLFDAVESPLSIQAPDLPSDKWKPHRRFILDAYDDFESLPSFFQEISTPLKFKLNKEGGYEMGMFNPEFGARNFYPGRPLVLLDDKLTRNSQFIAELDMDLIDTLDLFYYFEELKEQFGLLGHNGLVHIQTHGPGIELPPEDLYFSYQIPALLPVLTNQNRTLLDAGIPQISPRQYWDAGIEVNEEGVGNISFVQGDYPGRFLIEVCVQTENGFFGRIQSFYTVARSLSESID